MGQGGEVGISQQCKAESAGHVAVAYKARPAAELLSGTAHAPPPPERRPRFSIAVPSARPRSAASDEIAEWVSVDLGLRGPFELVDPRSFLADLEAEGLGIEVAPWRDVGATAVVKHRVRDQAVDFKLYEVDGPGGGTRPVLERSFPRAGASDAAIAHRFSADVVRHYTGAGGHLDGRLALVVDGGRALAVAGHDGLDPRVVAGGEAVRDPAWSPAGDRLAYTLQDGADQSHLYVVPADGGGSVRVAAFRGRNDGAAWSPDGSKLAVALSKDGNSEIYVVDAAHGRILSRLTNHAGRDTDPAWSPDGSRIAFVSDREGRPRIFVIPATGGTAKRIAAIEGDQADPAWSPEAGRDAVAFAVRVGERHEIATVDLGDGAITRVTHGEGDDRMPAFSPDGRVVAFVRTASGASQACLVRADGGGRVVSIKPGVTAVAWGAAPVLAR